MTIATAVYDVPNPTSLRVRKVKITCDASYPTGGYDVSSVIPNNANAVFGLAQQRYTTASQLVPVFRADTNKLALYESSTGAPLALVECAASSAHVTTSTIIDLVLFITDQVGATA